MPGTRELRVTYVEKCKDFVCDPVKPLVGAINAALSVDGELSFIKLNGNSKELFSRRLEYMQVFALAESLHVNNTVKEMDLSYNTIDDAGVATIARLLKVNRTLKSINLSGNNIGPEGAKKLADALADPGGGGGGLAVMNLRGNPIGEEGGMALAAMLRENTTLLDLDLGDCELGIKSLICVSAALNESNSTLQAIGLENPQIMTVQDEHVWHAARMLAANSSLRVLKMGKWKVRYSGAETLAAYGVCANSTLEVLDLRCNKICEVAGPSIARILTDNASLRCLNLEENALACNGAEAIAAALPASCSIVEMDLRCNGIGDRGLCALAAGIRNMQVKPEVVRLWGNSFGPASALAWASLLEECAAEGAPLRTDISCRPVGEDIHVVRVAVEA
uniref:Uncharacterized protein n=1 Tax=Mantoniella antarctica TaxID=81844 RepID=A0A7S0X688_9CHLO|mmetsp:Transcript_1679/g.3817  ORF Transcript_1679/g.3817 Transcript_1679/m.3817 type:complete len:392 (+) Transcript_1679:72-1247(+)